MNKSFRRGGYFVNETLSSLKLTIHTVTLNAIDMKIKYVIFIIVMLIVGEIHGQPDLIFKSTYSAKAEITTIFPEHQILFDNDGSIIVLVHSYNNGDDIVLLKYDSNGQLLWDYYYGSSHKLGERVNDMAIDSENNIIITGESYTKNKWDWDVRTEYETELTVLKFSPNGELLWNYNKIDNNDSKNCGNAIVLDSKDNIYLTGVLNDRTTAIKKMVAINLSKDGVEKWSKSVSGFSGQRISLVNESLVLVGTAGANENVFLKYDLEGNQLIKNEFENNHFLGSFEFDQEGSFYSCHWGNYTLSKHDSLGQLLWDFDIPITPPNTTSSDFIYDMSIDSDMNVYITGKHYDDATNADMLTYKIDRDGNEIWSIIDKTEGLNTAEIGKHVQTLMNGNVLISGEWQRAEASNENRNVIRSIDIKGEEIWRINTEYEEYPNDQVYPSIYNNRLYTFSWHEENNTLNKLVLKVYGDVTAVTEDFESKPNLLVYPNPSSREISISIPSNVDASSYIQFIDSSGRTVFSTEHRSSNNLYRYDSSLLKPGIYMIKVTSKRIVYSSKIIIK